jgi:hypothetical protein
LRSRNLIDIGAADPSWLGSVNFVLLLLATAPLAGMLRVEREATPA